MAATIGGYGKDILKAGGGALLCDIALRELLSRIMQAQGIYVSWHFDHFVSRDDQPVKKCPLCGCTEHRLIGCHRHKESHVKGPDGRCVVKS
jgi:hypothetical protein